jgi:hypothetical protein
MRSTEKTKRENITELSIGNVPVTATAAELNALAGSGATVDDLTKLHGVSASAATLNASVATPVAGVAAGYKLARGVGAVTGTLVVASGLATIAAVVATLKSDPAMTGNTVSADWTGANITLKVWKPTATGDVTPIASTVATNVSWVAVGT